MEKEPLLQAINKLEATFRQATELASNDCKDSRKEGIQLRRVVADQLATIFSIANLAFDGSELHEAFRSEFSRMRSTMAHHHASWPIVAIDLKNPDYLLSAAQMRKSNGAFIAWVKKALSTPG